MHYISISGGKIHLSSAAAKDTILPFASEDEAADAAAVIIMTSRVSAFQHSSSCFFPADDGRPDFDLDRFFNLVDRKLAEAGVETE